MFLPFTHLVYGFILRVMFLVLGFLACNCCWLAVCIVVVFLCVLLLIGRVYCCSCLEWMVVTFGYMLYCFCALLLFLLFYFRCRTAG
jgi:hypothetical protein